MKAEEAESTGRHVRQVALRARAWRAIPVALACSTLALLAAAPADAAAGWSVPVKLSPTGEQGRNPQAAVDAQGNAVAVWSGEGETRLQSATRPALSGIWQGPIELSSPLPGN